MLSHIDQSEAVFVMLSDVDQSEAGVCDADRVISISLRPRL